MNKEQVTGRANEAKGKVKEFAGKVVGDKSTQYTGKAEKHQGQVEAKTADLKNDAEKATS